MEIAYSELEARLKAEKTEDGETLYDVLSGPFPKRWGKFFNLMHQPGCIFEETFVSAYIRGYFRCFHDLLVDMDGELFEDWYWQAREYLNAGYISQLIESIPADLKYATVTGRDK